MRSSEYFGPAPQQPVTRAGSRVRRMILGPHPELTAGLPHSAGEVAEQLYVIAVRRRFVGRSGGDAAMGTTIETFAAAATRGAATDAHDCATIVQHALLGDGDDVGIPKSRLRKLIGDMVRRMRTDGSIPDSEVDPLVVSAESRAFRILRKEAAETVLRVRWLDPGWWSRMAFIGDYDHRPWPESAAHVPASVAGQVLRTIARFDVEKRDRLPDDPDDLGYFEVFNAAFELVLRPRFASSDGSSAVLDVAGKVSALSTVPIDRRLIAEEITKALSGVEEPGHRTADGAWLRALTLAQVAEEMGMYDSELDALLLQAERIATLRGCPPTPMPALDPRSRM